VGAVIGCITVTGCLGSWRPPEVLNQSRGRSAIVKPADCLEADLVGRWVYERSELVGRPDDPPVTYARVIRPGRRSEGVFVGRPIQPLENYLLDDREADSQPSSPLKSNEWGIFFELDPPIDPYPPELADKKTLVAKTALGYHDGTGRLQGRGTVQRTAELEGFEDVQTPAGLFARCLRVRVELHVRFPWMLTMNWTTYLWLSAEAGEVRRVERFSGWFLLFWFRSAYEYQLTGYEARPAPLVARPLPRCWAYGLYAMDRGVPLPRLSGLVVDSVTTQPAP